MQHSSSARIKLLTLLPLTLALAGTPWLAAADAPATASAPAPAAASATTTAAATTAALTAPTATPSDAPKVNTALVPVPQRGANYQTVHQRLVEQAKAGGIDVLFVGDSITDFWIGVSSGRATGKDVWDKNFAPLKAADFGYNADRTQNVLWRLQNGEGQGFSPKAIVLMIGTNNIGVQNRQNPAQGVRNTTPEAVAGVTAVVNELRKDFPGAKILLLAIFPRDDDQLAKSQIPQVNKELAKLDDQQHVFFLDLTKNFLDPDGNLNPAAFGADKLHPTALGYQIWADGIKEPLAKMLK
jgi:lysophospholipase L1-like esterase